MGIANLQVKSRSGHGQLACRHGQLGSGRRQLGSRRGQLVSRRGQLVSSMANLIRDQKLLFFVVGMARSNITIYTRTKRREFIFSIEEMLLSFEFGSINITPVEICLRLLYLTA